MRGQTTYRILALIVVACLAVWLPAPFALRLAAAVLLAFFLPGWLLLRAIGFRLEDRLAQGVLAVGVSYSLSMLLALLGLYVAGSLSAPLIVIVLGGVSLLLAVARRPAAGRAASSWPGRPDILLCLIPTGAAAFFSLVNLGYSDYIGDEMNGLLRAISIIHGRPETLFEHTKGPGEVLLPALFGLLVGRFEPFTLRLPFALAHIAGAGAFYLLGRSLFGRWVGFLASSLVVINGLYLAFGRMIQYQAVVFLMMALALWLAYHFYRTGSLPALLLSALLAGAGLLAHYDMLLVLPAMGYIVWRRYGWAWPDWRRTWPGLAGAGALLLAVAGLFYLPFLLHPHLAQTSSYLARVVGSSSWPGNNFDELYLFAVMYNSRYYALFIAVLGVGTVATELVRLLARQGRNRRLWLWVGLFVGLGLLALLLGRATFIPVLLFSLLFVLLVGLAPSSAERKLVYVWLGAAFIGYVFFVDRPRTHLQIIYLPWSLLAALALEAVFTRWPISRRRWLQAAGAAALALLFFLFGGYEYLLFVDAQREYIFTYPEHKRALYWEDENFPFGSRRLYGAPHRLGWQMINHLYLQGQLGPDWDSNDQGSNLFWYTLGSARNPCYPRYFFRTQFEQREEAGERGFAWSETDYVHIGQVWNRDRLQIDVYEFAPLHPVAEVQRWEEPARYSSFILPGDFQSLPYEAQAPEISHPLADPPTFRPSSPALEQIAHQYGDPRIVEVRDKVTLLGYDLDDRRAAPNGLLVLTLYWQAAEVVNLPYKVFVHLVGPDDTLLAQSDDVPACGTRPTQRWQVGQAVVDRHVIRLPANAPPGEYLLRVGLYEPQTGLRMDLLDGMGNAQGIHFELGRVVVRPGGA